MSKMITISGDASNRLSRLTAGMGYDKDGDTVRAALQLLEYMITKHKEGCTFESISVDGKREHIDIFKVE